MKKYIKLSLTIILATFLLSAVALAFVDSLTHGNETLNIEKAFEEKVETNFVDYSVPKEKLVKPFAKLKIVNEK
ncbi:MAG: hypothetical protein V4547_17910 [Bacteroidota bacterium]